MVEQATETFVPLGCLVDFLAHPKLVFLTSEWHHRLLSYSGQTPWKYSFSLTHYQQILSENIGDLIIFSSPLSPGPSLHHSCLDHKSFLTDLPASTRLPTPPTPAPAHHTHTRARVLFSTLEPGRSFYMSQILIPTVTSSKLRIKSRVLCMAPKALYDRIPGCL